MSIECVRPLEPFLAPVSAGQLCCARAPPGAPPYRRRRLCGSVKETVLHGPHTDVRDYGCTSVSFAAFREAQQDAAATAQAFLEQAAALDKLTWRVCIRGCQEQPALVHAVLAVLPATVRQLRLQVDCCGPLAAVLQRMPQLDNFSIDGPRGNGKHLQLFGAAAAAAARKITALRLDFREAPQWDAGEFFEPDITFVPESMLTAFAAATRLTSLELRAIRHDRAAQLCAALPTLEDLRLTLYMCTTEEASDAVEALPQLSRLRILSLTVHSGRAGWSQDPIGEVVVEDWEEWAILPSLAQLADRLTSLTLAGAVSLPPDWRELQHLRQLRVVHNAPWESNVSRWFAAPAEEDTDGFSWGEGSWSHLTALTRLSLSQLAMLPDVDEVATAPNLALVSKWGYREQYSTEGWKGRLRALRPDIVTWPDN